MIRLAGLYGRHSANIGLLTEITPKADIDNTLYKFNDFRMFGKFRCTPYMRFLLSVVLLNIITLTLKSLDYFYISHGDQRFFSI